MAHTGNTEVTQEEVRTLALIAAQMRESGYNLLRLAEAIEADLSAKNAEQPTEAESLTE